MTFRQAVLECWKTQRFPPDESQVIRDVRATGGENARRLWEWAEHRAIRRYERKTKKKFTGDWSTLIDWLKNNMGWLMEVLKLLLALLSK